MIYLPKNITLRLQPLDAGISQNFKCHYRKLLIKHTLAKIDSQSQLMAYDIAKSIDELMVIRMIKQAWDEVHEDTVIRCFKRCGALLNPTVVDEDPDLAPFADIDEELGELVQQVNPAMSATEYLQAVEQLPTCRTIPEGVRPEELREHLRKIVVSEQLESGLERPIEEPNHEEDDDNDIDAIELQPIITSFEKAITVSDDLLRFLTGKGEEGLADHLLVVIKGLNDVKWQQMKTVN